MKQNKLILASAIALTFASGMGQSSIEMQAQQKWLKAQYPEMVAATVQRKAYYVRYAKQNNRSQKTVIKSTLSQAVELSGARVDYDLDKYDTMAISFPADLSVELKNLPHIVFFEPVPEYKPMAQVVPWNIDQFQARDVWDTDRDGTVDAGAPNGSGVKFCIIDTGFYSAHDDFQGINHTGLSQIPGEAYTEDENGHGTHVAGTANAVNNNIGVVGVMPGGADLHIVKIFNNAGVWSTGNSNLGQAAINCKDNGANAISMSLGGGQSATEEAIFQDLYDNFNIVNIAAAGNDGNDTNSYPANYDSVISVAALDEAEVASSFSQTPPTSYNPLSPPANVEWDVVELSGGGEQVLSTWPGPPGGTNGNVPIYQVTNDGTDYSAIQIAETALGDVTQNLVDGGDCNTTATGGSDNPAGWSGNVVLCQRNAISFADKMNNVATNGGLAVVLYNNTAGTISATCNGACTSGATIPGVSITQAEGQFLLSNGLGLPTNVIADDGAGCGGCTGGYNTISGTSMATPGVAAGIAWAWDACGGPSGITNKQLRQLLRDSAKDLTGTQPFDTQAGESAGDEINYGAGYDRVTGFGLVQLKDALELGNSRFGSTCPIGLSIVPSELSVCTLPSAPDANFTVTLTDSFTGTSNMTSSGEPAGSTSNFIPSSVVFPSKTTAFNVTGLDNLAFGTHTITITATDSSDSSNNASTDVTLNTYSNIPASFALSTPVDTATAVETVPTFTWAATTQADSYTLEVATDVLFSNIVVTEAGITDTTHTITNSLASSTQHYWRVTSTNPCGNQVSSTFSFTTVNQICTTYDSTDVIQTIATNPAPGDVTSTLIIPDMGTIADVNVVTLTGQHTWVNDLIFRLQSPATTEIILMPQSCGNEDDWNLEFDDEAASSTLPCPPIGGGNYQPSGSLSDFDGEEMNGTWTFTVNDSVGGDGGQLDTWGLEICYSPAVATYTVGGSVTGLAGSGLVLQNNAGDDLALAADGSFTFSTALADLAAYTVTVSTQPNTPNQTCSVTNGSGNIASANVTNVSVLCTTTQYSVGGNVSGLTGSGLVLQNNAGDDLAIATDGPFTFFTTLDDLSAYSVSVSVQPGAPAQTCSVTSGSGNLAGANVSNVAVNCSDVQYTVGGSVSGLLGSGLILQNNLGDNLPIAADGSFTFSTSLADTDPYSVTVFAQPSSPSQSCSVTNAAGNISGTNVANVFVSCGLLPDISFSGTNLTQDVCINPGPTGITPVTLTTTALNGYNNTINLAFNPSLPTGFSGGIISNSFIPAVAPGTDSVLNLDVDNLATAGLNTITIDASGTGITTKSVDVNLNVLFGLSTNPVVSTPSNGSLGVATNTSFTWAAISGATGYDIDIATDAAFSNIVHFATNTASTSYTPGADLLDATIYYWRVRATNTCGNTDYTVSAFETAGGSGLSTTEFCSAANLNLTIPDNDANGVNNILNIIPTGNIQDVNIKVDITHGWVGDIIVGITSPNSPEVLVIDRPGYAGSGNGCSRDNIDTTLDDASATPVENICINNPPNPAIDTGPYSPNNPLISFNNTDLSGNWVINVSDNDNIIEGALNQWCVEATVDSGSPLNPADYSDLNSSYGVAKHEGGGAFMLGTTWSADTSFGEDSDTGDDGIVATGDWNIGSTINIEATVNIVSGYLSCWFDWNNNGIFDVSENTIAQQQLTSLVTDIPVTVPVGSSFGTNGDNFLETRCRLYDSVQSRAPAEPIGTATSGEVEDFRLPASDFTPVSLAYSKALSDNSGFKLDWSTTTEAGALAFNIYGLKGNTWSLLNSQPIATKGINSVVPQDYTFAVSDSQISEYKIEEITTKGSSITYGPFSSNIIHGKYPEVSHINWSSIAEESQSQLTNRIANRGVAADFVKVSVDKTGIQRITYNQLLTAGIDWQGVNSNEISLTFENVAVGRFVSSPVFGPGSYIEFVGLETKTLYTKTNVYELKLEENLVNNAIADASNNYIHDPDAYYMARNMIDNDVKYSFASPTDTPWYFTSMLVRSTSADWSYPLLAPHLINNGVTSHLRFNAWGGTDFPEDNDHHLQVLLNDQVVSDIVTDGLVLISDEVNVDYSLAQNLNSITFRLPADVASAADLIQLDNYSFEYPAEIYTDNDSLQFIPIVNSTLTDVLFADGYETNATTTLNGVANASHGFVAKGFVSDDLKAYAFDGINLIHFPNSAVASGSSGFEISLPHVSSPNMKYFLASDANIIQPSLSLASQTNIDLNGSYDYLMITHPDFVDTLAQLVTYHENNGLRVLVTDVNDIYADYSHHRVDAHAIQSFIADAAFQTGIQSVLIVGGDSYDYLDNLNIGSISFVPTLYYATDDIVKYTPVDALLVDTDNNLIPDLAIGRLPARTSQELQNMIDKILTFDGRNYSDTAVFATDRSSLFDHSSDQMIGELPNDWQVETAYINELEITAAKAKLINSLEAGVSLTSFFGHSGPSTWSFERLFDTNDLALLNNLNKPSLINQFGCWSTYHVAPQYNTMAHGFMELENKGAVSVLGASTLTDSAHESMFGNFLIPLMSQVNMPSGQAIQQAKAALATTNPDYLDVILGWTLLGDPMVILNQE